MHVACCNSEMGLIFANTRQMYTLDFYKFKRNEESYFSFPLFFFCIRL